MAKRPIYIVTQDLQNRGDRVPHYQEMQKIINGKFHHVHTDAEARLAHGELNRRKGLQFISNERDIAGRKSPFVASSRKVTESQIFEASKRMGRNVTNIENVEKYTGINNHTNRNIALGGVGALAVGYGGYRAYKFHQARKASNPYYYRTRSGKRQRVRRGKR